MPAGGPLTPSNSRGSYPDHFIDIRGKSEEDVKSLLQSDSPIVRAKEAKLCVMSIQNPGVGHSPSYTIGAYPQGINAKSSFNQHVTSMLLEVCRDSNYRIRLASVAADGVAVEER